MTPEQAKFLLAVFLRAIRREFPTTLRVIQAVPTDKGDYRPAPNSRSALELAWHLASADIWFLDGFLAGEFDMEDDTMPADFSNSAEIAASYEAACRQSSTSRSPRKRVSSATFFVLRFSAGMLRCAGSGIRFGYACSPPRRSSPSAGKLPRPSEMAAAAPVVSSRTGRAIGTSAPSASFRKVRPVLAVRPSRWRSRRPATPARWPADSPADRPGAARWPASGGARRTSGPFLRAAGNSRPRCVTRNRKRPFAVSSTRCCTIPSSISRICSSCSRPQRMEHDHLVDAVHEFRREFPLRRFRRRLLAPFRRAAAACRPAPSAQIPCRRSSAR